MPSSNPLPETGTNPTAPIAELLDWLARLAAHAGLGLAIGLVAARLMRRVQLHWSWAAGCLACEALAARSLIAGLTSTVGLATASATLWGRRWHRDDIDLGADLAALAAGRRTPLDLVRSGASRLALARRRRLGADAWFRDGRLILGCDECSRTVSIPAGDLDGAHTLVIGSTGSGKTVTQTWIAVRSIEQGMGAIVLDPKGDRDMRDALASAARGAARAFIDWTPLGPSLYNPYGRGSETQIADKVLAGERFTEPHYLRQAQRYMGHVVRALRHSGVEVSLRRIVDHLDPDELELLARTLPESEARRAHGYLDSLTHRQQAELAGVRDRLAILAESDIGPWLDPETGVGERFDLIDAVRARAVVYFSLESDSRPLLAQMLAAALVQDLQATVAELQGQPVPTLVVIDEFSAVAAEQVVRLFGRARSAGFSLLLATQELSDLRLPGRERLLEQVMGNLSTLIAHRQVVPQSAELVARLAGNRGAWRASQRDDGSITRSRTRAAVLDAEEVMRLDRGWAAIIALASGHGGETRVARVFRT
jgi:type IV secretory pathway TraG/TraD family ATPase VirD4